MLDPRLQTITAQLPYPHLLMMLSGAHLYGCPSSDSDYDLRGVYLLPVREVVGLYEGRDTITRTSMYEELEIDLVTYDLKKFLALLLNKEQPPRVKPLLYIYRVLLTGIHLMRTGEIESNLAHLNTIFKQPSIPDLIARKLAGPEHGHLEDADLHFHQGEYTRLLQELKQASEESTLPEGPAQETKNKLNDFLVRVRLETRP